MMFSCCVAAVQALTASSGGNASRRGRKDASKALVQKLKQTTTASAVAALLKDNQDLLNPFVVSTAMSKLRR